ncbi:phage tail tip lysozyme [Enterococcus gilvus]|uniref:Peptidase C51 domain-containing protein n=1 Tax=Enterococcus gilvus ATCC BAA-350 TaxID=1158614 RepID=R2XE41_9ENTE|nr:phage tail tip lysozyme [Enterococcus gilvus]EOI53109.1 hypothetical protein UKC_04017 [Enterococcus gilvus ATCC BAA-350]EOW78428.1 hypothetical protein I592_04021 [Enterococcus gilvus ATCC BAA-350]OJG40429.1 hypothetical protein RV02_GL002378 [Enterococcus gilvus]
MKKKLKIAVGLFAPLLLIFTVFIVFMSSSINQIDDESDCSATPSAQIASSNVDSKSKEENAKAIYDHVGSQIPESTPQGLVGMIGNFEQESQLNPAAVERPNDPLSGHGIAQWTAGRTTSLKNFASSKGKEWSNLGLQLEYLISELKGAEKNGVSALKASSVAQATEEWQTKFERAGIPAMGNRLTYADKWFAKLGTSDPVASAALSLGADAKQEKYNSDCTSSTSDSDNGDIVKTAKQFIGWFNYSQPMRTQFGTIETPNKEGYTDCSSFVWFILTKAGYKTPANVGWYTGSMTPDARGTHQYLKEVSKSDAKAGDIIIVNQGSGAGNDGHTAVLIENWHGNTTKIIESGGMQNGKVGQGQVDLSFGYLLNGGDICIARPIKK